MRKCLFVRSNCQNTSMEGGHVTFSFSSIEFRYESMSDIMPFFIFQRSFSAQWMIVEGSRPVSLVMCWISGSEKKQAGALGSMVRLRQAWMGWEKRGHCLPWHCIGLIFGHCFGHCFGLHPKIALKRFTQNSFKTLFYFGPQRAQNKRALPDHPHQICPPRPRPPRQPLLAQPLGAHTARSRPSTRRVVQKLEAQIQDLEARLLKKRKRIESITHYVQPYDDGGKVPCTLVGVRRDRYEALLQLPCYRLGSEPTCFEERSALR